MLRQELGSLRQSVHDHLRGRQKCLAHLDGQRMPSSLRRLELELVSLLHLIGALDVAALSLRLLDLIKQAQSFLRRFLIAEQL